MKPDDTVTHVAMPDRVLTVRAGFVEGRVRASDGGTLTIVDTADNFRPYPPRKSTAELMDEVSTAFKRWGVQPAFFPTENIAETRALIAAAQAYLDRLEETE